MPGALVLAVIIVVVIPVSVMLTGAAVAAILGWSLRDTAAQAHEGSELLELS